MLDLSQLSHSPYFQPLHHDDIPLVIEARAVRADEFPRREMVARQLTRVVPLRFRIVAQIRDHSIVLIHQSHPRPEIRHYHVAVLEVIEVTGQIRAADEVDMLPVEREALDALVAAIGNQ